MLAVAGSPRSPAGDPTSRPQLPGQLPSPSVPCPVPSRPLPLQRSGPFVWSDSLLWWSDGDAGGKDPPSRNLKGTEQLGGGCDSVSGARMQSGLVPHDCNPGSGKHTVMHKNAVGSLDMLFPPRERLRLSGRAPTLPAENLSFSLWLLSSWKDRAIIPGLGKNACHKSMDLWFLWCCL